MAAYEYSESLRRQIGHLEYKLRTDKELRVIDPKGEVHHEFKAGDHGLKVDVGEDHIATGSAVYIDICATWAKAFTEIYLAQSRPQAIAGIEGGGTRYANSIAGLIGNGIILLTTMKSKGLVLPSPETVQLIADQNIQSVVLFDDIGTTGLTLAQVADRFYEIDVVDIEALNFWQRNDNLTHLDEREIVYRGVINTRLEALSPEECVSRPDADCAQGVPLIPHSLSQLV